VMAVLRLMSAKVRVRWLDTPSKELLLRSIRFVQISDVHLESPFSGLRWEVGRRELRRAFSAAIGLAKESSADLLLMPGDVYEHENETSGTAGFLAREFERLSPIQVVIAPGNHDFYAGGGIWQRAQWPENVHLFREERISGKAFPKLGVTVYGFAHNSSAPLPAMLSGWRVADTAHKSILVFHGSLAGGGSPKKKVTCPFAPTDIEQTGVDYAAVGHYHGYSEIRSEGGKLVGAYSGCPAGRGFDETGDRFVILGEMSEEGVELSKKTVARYRYEKLVISMDGVADEREAEGRIREAVDGATNQDVLRVVLRGRVPPDFERGLVSLDQDATAAHVELEWQVEPEYDIDAIARKNTTEGEFVREMLARSEKAPSEEEVKISMNALYYGLDALSGREPEERQ